MNKSALEKLGLDESATDEQVNEALDALIARAAPRSDTKPRFNSKFFSTQKNNQLRSKNQWHRIHSSITI